MPLRAGAENTVASTWLLESPGHIANKFSSFVRVIYTTESSEDEDVSSSSPPDENSNAVIAPIEKGGDEKEENGGKVDKADENGDDLGVSKEGEGLRCTLQLDSFQFVELWPSE